MAAQAGRGGKRLSLWARAPLWRFVLFSALLFSLIFIALAPPIGAQKQMNQATGYLTPPSYHPVLAERAVPVQLTPATPLAVSAAVAVTPAVSTAPAQPAPAGYSQQQAPPTTASLSLATPGAAPDATDLDKGLVGRLYKDTVRVNGFSLPLPPGEWAVIASLGSNDHNVIGDTVASGVVYFLGHIVNKRLQGAIMVTAMRSQQLPGAGFNLRGCDSNDPHLNYVHIESMIPLDHQACWTVFNIYTPPWQQWGDKAVPLQNVFRAAAGDMAAKGVSYPQDLMVVRFLRAEKWGYIDANYMSAPEAEGISSNVALSYVDSDWSSGNVTRFPEKNAFVSRLKSWAGTEWPQIKTAFQAGQPPGVSTPQMADSGATPATSFVRPPSGHIIAVAYGGPLDLPSLLNLSAFQVRARLVDATFVDSEEPDAGRRNLTLNPTNMACQIFFDDQGLTKTIHLYPPYLGDVLGIHLGDSLAVVKKIMGEPFRPPFAAEHNQAYVYKTSPSYYTRYDINPDGRVGAIFVTR